MHDELREIVRADHADRSGTAWDDDPDGVVARDAGRAARVLGILDATPHGDLSAVDLVAAALVLQHAGRLEHQHRAAELALAALDRGLDRARPLYAAAVDRSLMRQTRPQRFGTQYTQRAGGPLELWPVEPATTDDERAAWDVPPLAEALARVDGRIAQLTAFEVGGDDMASS